MPLVLQRVCVCVCVSFPLAFVERSVAVVYAILRSSERLF